MEKETPVPPRVRPDLGRITRMVQLQFGGRSNLTVIAAVQGSIAFALLTDCDCLAAHIVEIEKRLMHLELAEEARKDTKKSEVTP